MPPRNRKHATPTAEPPVHQRTTRQNPAPSKPTHPRKKAKKANFPVTTQPEFNTSTADESEFGPAEFEIPDSEEEEWVDEDNNEDNRPTITSSRRHPNTTTPLPVKSTKAKIKITLENYQDLDLDMSTINSLIHADGRKTRNRIPPAIQKELKNIQFIYRRAKKLLALVAHCSEQTINEFLWVPHCCLQNY